MSLTVTCIQTDLYWEDKQANLEMLANKILSIKEKTEVVVLPEMFSTGFSMRPRELAETIDGATFQWMHSVAAERRIVLTGSLIIEEEGHYYNRLIWMLPNGEYGYYDKRHLFAYAKEDLHYTSGKRRLIASVKGWKINSLICYDLRFPVWSRHQPEFASSEKSQPEYDLLVYVANWPEKRSNAWKILLQARAIENQCYVVGVNRVGTDGNGHHYSGDSMIVDPLGEIIQTESQREAIFTQTLDKSMLEETRTKLPFLRDADAFLIQS